MGDMGAVRRGWSGTVRYGALLSIAPIAIVLVWATLVGCVLPTTRALAQDEPTRSVSDDLARIALDSRDERFDAALFALGQRDDAAAPLRRLAATTESEPVALLAEGLRGLAIAGDLRAKTARPLPHKPPRARWTLPVRGLDLGVSFLVGREVPRFLRIREGGRVRLAHEVHALDADGRAAALLRLQGMQYATGVRFLPWLTWALDSRDVSGRQRLAAAEALSTRRHSDTTLRIVRLANEARAWRLGIDARATLAPIAATRTREAVHFLLRVSESRVKLRDGGDPALARDFLAEICASDPELYADALRGVGPGSVFESVRVYQAETQPILHSTGRGAAGGWQAQRGRDRTQHMLYGPYVSDLPTDGGLHARFRFRIDGVADGSGDEVVLQLEVTSQAMERNGWRVQKLPIRRREVRVGEWVERHMPFHAHPRNARMEFRVFWDGKCDVTVDRIDVLRTRSLAARALPPRAPIPMAAQMQHSQRLPETSQALFDASLQASGRLYRSVRRVLFDDPGAARAVLIRESKTTGERAWRADVLLARLDHPDEFARLATRLADVMTRVESARLHNRYIDPRPEPPIWHDALVEGTCAVEIEGASNERSGIQNWVDSTMSFPVPGPLTGYGTDAPSGTPLLPSSDLWPAIFAEVLLTEEPRSLPATDSEPAPPPRNGEAQSVPIPPTLRISTVGHRRLHALQWLAWLGDDRVRPALIALRKDPRATAAERRVAERRLVDLDR